MNIRKADKSLLEAVKNGLIDFAVVSSPVYVDTSLKMVLLHSFQEILVGGTTFTAALYMTADIQ